MLRKRSKPPTRRAGAMLPARARGVVARGVAVMAVQLVWPVNATAQCALCGQGTRYAGSSPEGAVAALLAGTIVLLLPPVSVAVCIGRFLWKHRQS